MWETSCLIFGSWLVNLVFGSRLLLSSSSSSSMVRFVCFQRLDVPAFANCAAVRAPPTWRFAGGRPMMKGGRLLVWCLSWAAVSVALGGVLVYCRSPRAADLAICGWSPHDERRPLFGWTQWLYALAAVGFG